jgi:hypothetical protein
MIVEKMVMANFNTFQNSSVVTNWPIANVVLQRLATFSAVQIAEVTHLCLEPQ